MILTDQKGWEQFMEGTRRGDVPQYQQYNRTDGTNTFRDYQDGETIVAQMCILEGSVSDSPSHELERVFHLTQDIIDATQYIYIPTQEQWDEWDDPHNGEIDVDAYIAEQESS